MRSVCATASLRSTIAWLSAGIGQSSELHARNQFQPGQFSGKKGSQEWLQKRCAFDVGDYVVYPKHGVGRVIELQSQKIAGIDLELYVLRFEKERMTLRVPTNKAESVGMRKLSSDKTLGEALETLKGQAARQADHVVAPRAGI